VPLWVKTDGLRAPWPVKSVSAFAHVLSSSTPKTRTTSPLSIPLSMRSSTALGVPYAKVIKIEVGNPQAKIFFMFFAA
jgi:hypothetical protein